MEPIPVKWILEQVDLLTKIASDKLENGPRTPMQEACYIRAEYYMDLVEAWKQKQQESERK